MRRFLRFSLAVYGSLFVRLSGALPVSPPPPPPPPPRADEADEALAPAASSSSAGGGSWTDLGALHALTGVGEADVLLAEWSSGLYCPGHLVLLDHVSSAVVVAVRGSARVQDVLTDLVCERATFECELGTGWAHAGMLKAATRLLEAVMPTVRAALSSHPGYRLVLTGHSLGGGLAALLAMLLGTTLVLSPTPLTPTRRRVTLRRRRRRLAQLGRRRALTVWSPSRTDRRLARRSTWRVRLQSSAW